MLRGDGVQAIAPLPLLCTPFVQPRFCSRTAPAPHLYILGLLLCPALVPTPVPALYRPYRCWTASCPPGMCPPPTGPQLWSPRWRTLRTCCPTATTCCAQVGRKEGTPRGWGPGQASPALRALHQRPCSARCPHPQPRPGQGTTCDALLPSPHPLAFFLAQRSPRNTARKRTHPPPFTPRCSYCIAGVPPLRALLLDTLWQQFVGPVLLWPLVQEDVPAQHILALNLGVPPPATSAQQGLGTAGVWGGSGRGSSRGSPPPGTLPKGEFALDLGVLSMRLTAAPMKCW